MPQVLSSAPPATTAHAVDSFDHFASGEPLAPELADLVSRIQSWRDHKTFKAQAMPDELKFSIAKLLTSGLHSRAALAKQLGISYNQVANIEANFVNHSDLNTNQSVDLNFLPFKIIPQYSLFIIVLLFFLELLLELHLIILLFLKYHQNVSQNLQYHEQLLLQ